MIAIDEVVLKNMPRRKTEGEYFYQKNYNPWAQNIGDCAVRAISAALAMRYVDVCRNLHIRFKNGVGLVKDGIVFLKTVPGSALAEYFYEPVILQANGFNFSGISLKSLKNAKIMPNANIRVNLNDFCSVVAKRAPNDIFLVLCRDAENDDDGHAVAVFAEQTHPYFVDTWDSGDMLVYGYMKVKKQVARNSKERINMKEFDLEQAEKLKARRRLEQMLDSIFSKEDEEDESRGNGQLTNEYIDNYMPGGADQTVRSAYDRLRERIDNDEDFVLFDFIENAEYDDLHREWVIISFNMPEADVKKQPDFKAFTDVVYKICRDCRLGPKTNIDIREGSPGQSYMVIEDAI